MGVDYHDRGTIANVAGVARVPPQQNWAWERNGTSEPMANHALVVEVTCVVAIVSLAGNHDHQQRECDPAKDQPSTEMKWIFL